MQKNDTRSMRITFNSEKNQSIINVNSKYERAYSRKLEEDNSVLSYKACVPLDVSLLNQMDFTDIRKQYRNIQWLSSFVIKYSNGETGVRELINTKNLSKLAEIEKLELSRRYWKLKGINNWKVVEVE